MAIVGNHCHSRLKGQTKRKEMSPHPNHFYVNQMTEMVNIDAQITSSLKFGLPINSVR